MISETMTSSSEWFPFYEPTSTHGLAAPSSSFFEFSEANMVTTTTAQSGHSDHCLVLSPSCSTTTTAPLTPKGCVSKPIRRRSRASKKTPTTLLNANISNFRALVQQFTGCHSSTRSLGKQKGPINLNFQLGSVQNHSTETTRMNPFSKSCNTCYPHEHHQMQKLEGQQQPLQQQDHDHQQLLQQEQKHMVSSLEDVCFPGPGDIDSTATAGTNLQIPDELLIMDDFSLHELARESLYDEI